ncbi:MlaC/ttg2D family ABC transporter substrate-binding protein [Aliikangiella sp. IMCC44632]
MNSRLHCNGLQLFSPQSFVRLTLRGFLRANKHLSRLLWLSLSFAVFQTQASSVAPNHPAASYFKLEITEINQLLRSQQASFEQYPERLVKFVDERLLPLWSASTTLTGMLGKTSWNSLSPQEKAALNQGFNNTIQRYVQEGFQQYDGQQFNFVELKLNKSETLGLLTVEFVPNVLPSFNVDFKVRKVAQQWLLYDVLVQGVSYIKLKKGGYREQFKQGGVKRVLAEINDKNQGFMASQKNSEASRSQPKTSKALGMN